MRRYNGNDKRHQFTFKPADRPELDVAGGKFVGLDEIDMEAGRDAAAMRRHSQLRPARGLFRHVA